MREQIALYDGVTAPRGGKEEREHDYAKTFLPYVYSTSRNAALVHRVLRVQVRWWDCAMTHMLRRQSPILIVECACGMFFRINGAKAKMCEIPKPDAVLCGACNGKGRNFPRRRPADIPLSLAKIRIGCIERAQ
jgi:hypothetical protein